jgi:transposase
MGKRGRLYPPEFKEEAVRMVHSSDEKYPVSKIARDLDVSTETLRKWVNQAEIDAGDKEGLTTEEKEELRSLRREVKVLREDGHHICKDLGGLALPLVRVGHLLPQGRRLVHGEQPEDRTRARCVDHGDLHSPATAGTDPPFRQG